MEYRIEFHQRTMAWFPFFWFHTMAWMITNERGYVVATGWGRRSTAIGDANAALARAYREHPNPIGGVHWEDGGKSP